MAAPTRIRRPPSSAAAPDSDRPRRAARDLTPARLRSLWPPLARALKVAPAAALVVALPVPLPAPVPVAGGHCLPHVLRHVLPAWHRQPCRSVPTAARPPSGPAARRRWRAPRRPQHPTACPATRAAAKSTQALSPHAAGLSLSVGCASSSSGRSGVARASAIHTANGSRRPRRGAGRATSSLPSGRASNTP